MTSKLVADPRIDPRLKALFAWPDRPPVGDIASREALLAEANSPAALAGEAARDITVLALTANVMPEDIARCEASGFSGHVAKPFTVAILREALAAWLAPAATAH